MKTMTCNQLGGACELEFRAKTFEEIAAMSKNHGMEMFQKGDMAHIKAMKKMKDTMKTPEDFQNWLSVRQKEFDALSED